MASSAGDDSSSQVASNDDRFVSLMTAAQQDLRAFVLSLIPSQVEADDILQEVYMALWKKRASYFEQDVEFIRWAVGFTTVEIRRYRNRVANSRLWFSDEAIQLLADDWTKPDSFAANSKAALRGCIQKLAEPQRRIIEDKYLRSLTAKQIASKSGRPLSTVYKVMHRALESLRECVDRSNRQLDR